MPELLRKVESQDF